MAGWLEDCSLVGPTEVRDFDDHWYIVVTTLYYKGTLKIHGSYLD